MAELILDGATRAVDLSSFNPARLAALDPRSCHRPAQAPWLTKPITPQADPLGDGHRGCRIGALCCGPCLDEWGPLSRRVIPTHYMHARCSPTIKSLRVLPSVG